jgi:hypothetical protein
MGFASEAAYRAGSPQAQARSSAVRKDLRAAGTLIPGEEMVWFAALKLGPAGGVSRVDPKRMDGTDAGACL